MATDSMQVMETFTGTVLATFPLSAVNKVPCTGVGGGFAESWVDLGHDGMGKHREFEMFAPESLRRRRHQETLIGLWFPQEPLREGGRFKLSRESG